MSEWTTQRLEEIIQVNPTVKLTKGEVYPFIDIDKVSPSLRSVTNEEEKVYDGQSCSKFCNGDTVFSRITPCLENRKIAKVSIDGQAAFGSTEFYIFRAKQGKSDEAFVYYLTSSDAVVLPAINSMTGASGRQRADKRFIERTKLDRCIPEYQIKVLERLHHIFNDIENMQVILAVDKAQLERTIQKMFGDNVDTQKYLAKFINFEIELDEGTYNRRFEEMFDFYFNQFDGNDDPDIIEFKSNIFVGIATREKIEIVEKCHLLHNLLDEGDERKHATFMCVELFLTIIRHTKAKLPHKPQGLYFGGMFGDKSTNGLNFIEEKMGRTIDYGDERGTRAYYYAENNGRRYLLPKDLWGILLGCYATITESQLHGVSENRETMATIKEYTKQFWTLLKTIK